jgi:hypothetical protein
MTIDEIHIKVRQDVQKLDSHANGNLLDEEIDFHLNYYTKKFVDGVVGKLRGLSTTNPTDFQKNQRLLDSISTLQVRNRVLAAYVAEDGVAYGILPPNYRHLTEDVSEIAYNCKGVVKNPVDAKIYTHSLSFLADYETFSELELKIEGDTFFKLTDYLPNGITDPESKYQIVNLILDNTPYNIYWEYYDGKYFPRSFIFADFAQFNISYSITTKNEDDVDITDTISVIRELVLNKVYRPNPTDKYSRRPNRLTKDNNLNYVLHHPFEKTTWEFPVSTLGNGRLYVYEDDKFRVRSLIINYIKEPIEASKSRSVNVELPNASIQLVVEQLIVHLKGMIQDATWQTDVQHNNLTNQ